MGKKSPSSLMKKKEKKRKEICSSFNSSFAPFSGKSPLLEDLGWLVLTERETQQLELREGGRAESHDR